MQQRALVSEPGSSACRDSALMVCPVRDRHARVESREAGQQLRVAGSAMLAVGRLRRLVKAHVGADNDQPIQEGPSLLSSEPGLYSCLSHVKVRCSLWPHGTRVPVTLLQSAQRKQMSAEVARTGRIHCTVADYCYPAEAAF